MPAGCGTRQMFLPGPRSVAAARSLEASRASGSPTRLPNRTDDGTLRETGAGRRAPGRRDALQFAPTCSATAHRNNQLAVIGRPNAKVFSARLWGNISWAKLTSMASEAPSSSFNVKTPSSRVIWALSFRLKPG